LTTAFITRGLTQNAALRNSWEENGKAVRLYDVKVVNETKKAITSWSLSLDLDKSFELRQIWGAKGQIKGNTLTLTPESYNRTVAAGGDAGEIGFILVER
jgi:cellulase/cellobiase CelA1